MISLQRAFVAQLGGILNRLDDPVLLIDRYRNIFFHNMAAVQILKAGMGLSMRAGRLAFSTPECNVWLERLTADCQQPAEIAGGACRGLRLSQRASSKDWLIMISTLPAGDVLHDSTFFIVHLISSLHPRELPTKALHDLFGLTRKETDLLVRLARSETLREIAARMTLSHETIRAHLKQIFRKCDVRSQIELLALLQKISLFA